MRNMKRIDETLMYLFISINNLYQKVQLLFYNFLLLLVGALLFRAHLGYGYTSRAGALAHMYIYIEACIYIYICLYGYVKNILYISLFQ